MPSTTIRRKITGSGPFEYVWTSNDDCISFSDPSGSTDQYVETIVTYVNSACLAGAIITLKITDSEGCTSSTAIVPNDQCDNLSSIITLVPPFKFISSAGSVGCSSVSFTWAYNTSLFSLVSRTDSSFTSTLQLGVKSATLPLSTVVSATARDCNQCVSTQSYTITFCIPQALNYQTEAIKSGSSYVTPYIYIEDPTGCIGYEYDWDTLQIEFPSLLWSYDSDDNAVQLTTTETPGNYQLKYSVATTEGIRSNKGVITVSVIAENEGDTISLVNKKFDIACDVMPTDIIQLLIEDLVIPSSGSKIDWDTWQVVEPPVSLSPSITLSSNPSGQHVILYEVPTPVSGDVFGWTVADTNGNYAQVTVTTLLDCASSPTATNDSATVGCGDTVNINLVNNDLGNGSPLKNTSIVITAAPTLGTVTLLGDGTADYTANEGESGADTFSYTIQNAFGKTSNEAVVTVTISCAGADVEYALCD